MARFFSFLGVMALAAIGLALFSPQACASVNYDEHIIAVDEQGRALQTQVFRNKAGRYYAKHRVMKHEDTMKEADIPYWRQSYSAYLDQMLTAISKKKKADPQFRLVIYIHGGLNKIDEAISKSAALADRFEGTHIYFIGICWNSDLIPTYGERLLYNREGLCQPMRSTLTAPLALLADAGAALTRLPLNLVSWGENDVWSLRPSAFARQRMADLRYFQLQGRMQLHGEDAPQVSRGDDDRPSLVSATDVTSKVATIPLKIATTPIIDALGTQSWRNMLRRTRTMFERETTFLAPIIKRQNNRFVVPPVQKAIEAAYAYKISHRAEDREAWLVADREVDQMIYNGRRGATEMFCGQVLDRLPRNSHVTLIGHSMGAIVAGEMLQRHLDLPLENLVFMAGAESISDFKAKVLPYLLRVSPQGRPNHTRFYNLCLNPAAERSERNPWNLDLTPRGSLLVWIDSLYEDPISENDRTIGRWENAILFSDNLPRDVMSRITIKSFGRDRPPGAPSDERRSTNPPSIDFYTDSKLPPKPRRTLYEPTKHGDFSHYETPFRASTPNFAYWEKRYWEVEK